MKKIYIVIGIIVVLTIGCVIAFVAKKRLNNEEIITEKNEEDISSTYRNLSEYEYKELNEKIKYKECFSYEEKITNKLYATIHNNSDMYFSGVDVFVIYYDNDKVIYIEKKDVYGGLTPRSKYIVDLGFIPEKTTKHEIIIIPSYEYEDYKDMSDFIKTDIVKKNKEYYCKIENKSDLKIDHRYVQLIFYDKENNIIATEEEGFYDINLKKTQQKELFSLKNFDHYEAIVNAYNYK